MRRTPPQTAQELPGSEGEFPSQRAVAFSPSGDLVAISQVRFHEPPALSNAQTESDAPCHAEMALAAWPCVQPA